MVAQSVEQRTENPCVGGSNPPRTTKKTRTFIKFGFFVGTISKFFKNTTHLFWVLCNFAPQ